jgi:outer membrane lipase/esterase
MRYLLVVLLLLVESLPALASQYSNIYFFGDSLSDVGNVQNTYASLPGPLPAGSPSTVPGAPYDSQGRFSNGQIYADVLAANLGFTAVASTVGGNDYAYGGARTRYQVFGPPFKGILDQVTSFRSLPGSADPGALYVVWGGANNLQDLLNGKTTDSLGNPIPGLSASVGDIANSVLALYAEGARKVLLPNLPDLGLTPRVRDAGPLAQGFATQLSVTFNSLLANSIVQLEANNPGLDIIPFDTYGALNDLIANAASHGISNTTNRCYSGDDLNFTGGGSVCGNPDSYLFWDGIHPTSAVSSLFGQQMTAAVVPEPSAQALYAVGLLTMAFVWRRQRSGN